MKYKPMNERHPNFTSSNKFVIQMCFQYIILIHEKYKICTSSIIKSWNVKFVMQYCKKYKNNIIN
jgi:hypothetical protein